MLDFYKGSNELYVDSYKGVVEINMVDTWNGYDVPILLSYSEWDDLVKHIEEARAKEKLNA